jgi:FAD/FMN-containing dehydrogenase
MKRRDFLKLSGAACASLSIDHLLLGQAAAEPPGVLVNDVHSQLNETLVRSIERPTSIDDIQRLVRAAKKGGRLISIAAGRHAMGGQQFGADTALIDMMGMQKIVRFDARGGLVEAEAGTRWPQLVSDLISRQGKSNPQWGIIQKQTGADRLSLGGALAANIHGRGLNLKPFISDVESFVLIDADGEPRTCSRRENSELFCLAIGGYGLFGIVAQVTLRLNRRCKLRRVVTIERVDDVPGAFAKRIAEGCMYGDFQYSIAAGDEDYLREGVFSCYQPLGEDADIPAGQRELKNDDWRDLLCLAHSDKRHGFDLYKKHYLATSGQIYWSDTHQLSDYVDEYHREIDRRAGARVRGTEMITEIYVPRADLPAYLSKVRSDFQRDSVNLIYGTVRLIEKDDESFLAWATKPYACIIFNLHVDHTGPGREKAAREFRGLIDRAMEYGGSYYLTYHRWATRRQVETCYPRFPEFLKLKRKYDPGERFQSDWYRHYRKTFVGA